mmetsp:Transcript_38877/g.86899  ORF Transcript_38877/g.86899 Transcript_38877/m.86899 type:complete len:419 (+) Transcript_38877:207-1463(+)
MPCTHISNGAVAYPVRSATDRVNDRLTSRREVVETAHSNFFKDFPLLRFGFSVVVMLSISSLIGCYSANCCAVSPSGKSLDTKGDRSAVSAQERVNNGLCECAGLGERCGCLGYMVYGKNKNSDTQSEVQKCEATCCAVGKCTKPGGKRWKDTGDTKIYKWPEKHPETKKDQEQSVRKKRARKQYRREKAEAWPTCVGNYSAVDLAAMKPEEPNCNCCKGTRAAICSNTLLIWAIVLMSVCWCGLLSYELGTMDTNVFGATSEAGEPASDQDVTRFTEKLCEAKPDFFFNAKCYHTESRGSGKNRRTVTVVTHTARKKWTPMNGYHSVELSGQPLVPYRKWNGILQVKWRDFTGLFHTTECSKQVLEVRVAPVRVSFATGTFELAFAEDFSRFKAANNKDRNQDYHVDVTIEGPHIPF